MEIEEKLNISKLIREMEEHQLHVLDSKHYIAARTAARRIKQAFSRKEKREYFFREDKDKGIFLVKRLKNQNHDNNE